MLKEINKWVPVHKNTILLLKDDPRCHLETLCVLYLYKTKVPADALPDLIAAFEGAIKVVKKCSLKFLGKQVIFILNEQLEENKHELPDSVA